MWGLISWKKEQAHSLALALFGVRGDPDSRKTAPDQQQPQPFSVFCEFVPFHRGPLIKWLYLPLCVPALGNSCKTWPRWVFHQPSQNTPWGPSFSSCFPATNIPKESPAPWKCGAASRLVSLNGLTVWISPNGHSGRFPSQRTPSESPESRKAKER